MGWSRREKCVRNEEARTCGLQPSLGGCLPQAKGDSGAPPPPRPARSLFQEADAEAARDPRGIGGLCMDKFKDLVMTFQEVTSKIGRKTNPYGWKGDLVIDSEQGRKNCRRDPCKNSKQLAGR